MSKTYTVTEIADLLAGHDASPEDRDLLHRQIRILYKKRFLDPVGVKDARGTVEFDTLALYRVRVLSALISAGFDSDSGIFREAVRAMMAQPLDTAFVAPSTKFDGYVERLGGLKDAVRGVAFGEQWRLTFSHQVPHLHGFRHYSASFTHVDDVLPGADVINGLICRTVFRGEILLNDLFDGLPTDGLDFLRDESTDA